MVDPILVGVICSTFHLSSALRHMNVSVTFIIAFHMLTHCLLQETDDDIESTLDGSQDVYEGNKDAARALLRVKQKLDGYEDGEMRSVQGQVSF